MIYFMLVGEGKGSTKNIMKSWGERYILVFYGEGWRRTHEQRENVTRRGIRGEFLKIFSGNAENAETQIHQRFQGGNTSNF